MIRVTVLFPNKPGAKFDFDYYIERHVKPEDEKLRQLGLVKSEIDKGVGGMTAGSLPPYVTIGHLIFNSMEDLQRANAARSGEPTAEVHKFTNIEPQIQISEIIT